VTNNHLRPLRSQLCVFALKFFLNQKEHKGFTKEHKEIRAISCNWWLKLTTSGRIFLQRHLIFNNLLLFLLEIPKISSNFAPELLTSFLV